MSRMKNSGIRCYWCGKLTRDQNGYYRRPDGTAGYIHQPEWERFLGGDPTQPSIPSTNDICEECSDDICPMCGSDQIVHTTPCVPGPVGWGGRCKACGKSWGMPTD